MSNQISRTLLNRYRVDTFIDRFRLGLTIVCAWLELELNRVEAINVEKWLTRISGRRTFEHFWRPMLRAKFDGSFENT